MDKLVLSDKISIHPVENGVLGITYYNSDVSKYAQVMLEGDHFTLDQINREKRKLKKYLNGQTSGSSAK